MLLTWFSTIILLGISSILGFMGNTSAMALSVVAGALGLGFSNIDKIRKFKGAGFEAEMFHKIEAIVEKETEPEAESEDKGTYWYAKTRLNKDEQSVINALANPAFTWRYVSGLSKESGLPKNQVRSILKALEEKKFAERSLNEKGEIWTPSRRGRNASILMAGDLNQP